MKQYCRISIKSLKLKSNSSTTNFKPDLHFQKEIDVLKLQTLTLEKQLETRKENELKLQKQNDVLKSQLLALKFTHKQCTVSVSQKLRKILGNIFTPFFKKKKFNKSKRQVWWEDGGIASAITLGSLSRKGFSYLRKKVGIPLPGLSSTTEMDERCEMRSRSPRRNLDCSACKVTNNDSF
ncbi:hypothetical protein PR048_006804 [Dryococelus australis]|uniref:Uncharacterized protein n=1 Tax=Dryococelus australis TaxID=614101 RepID=A0ABQ9IBZ4_9NEOP|nr:hypothetical protein PR048_006804 [Dryococelus australis]